MKVKEILPYIKKEKLDIFCIDKNDLFGYGLSKFTEKFFKDFYVVEIMPLGNFIRLFVTKEEFKGKWRSELKDIFKGQLSKKLPFFYRIKQP